MASGQLTNAWIESHDGGDDDVARWLGAERPHHAALRAALAPGYESLPAETLDDIVGQTLASLPPDEAEGLGSFVSGLGRAIAPIASQLLPVAAPLIGTAIGGPVGAAIGTTVGQLVAPRPAPPRPVAPVAVAPLAPLAPVAPVVAAPVAQTVGAPLAQPPVPGGGQGGVASAIAQLVSLLQNPALAQSLAGQVLGPVGARTVPVGPNAVPVSFPSFMNALATLATQAATVSTEAYGEAADAECTAYLRDPSGRFAYDPAVPEDRAAALLGHLRAGEAAEASEAYDGYDTTGESLGDWLARAGLVR